MARPPLPRPTDAELQILAVLWKRGGATVRQLHTELHPIRSSGYNSVLKLVQIMHRKGYLRRDDSQRPQVYHPAMSEQQTKRLLLNDLLERVFAGSLDEMIGLSIGLKKLSPQQAVDVREQLEKSGASPRRSKS